MSSLPLRWMAWMKSWWERDARTVALAPLSMAWRLSTVTVSAPASRCSAATRRSVFIWHLGNWRIR